MEFHDVVWLNAEQETGLPYDVRAQRMADGATVYFEVKSTSRGQAQETVLTSIAGRLFPGLELALRGITQLTYIPVPSSSQRRGPRAHTAIYQRRSRRA